MAHTPAAAQPAERNAHVHPALRGVLNAFSPTVSDWTPEERADLQAERRAEWRAEDRERLALERNGDAA